MFGSCEKHVGASPHGALGDNSTLGPEERWLSAAVGACLAGYGLSRLRLRTLAAIGIGGFLVYRGSVGRCPLREKLLARSERFTWRETQAPAAAWPAEAPEAASVEERALRVMDCIDEAAMESFPASDPPSHTGTTAPPLVPIV